MRNNIVGIKKLITSLVVYIIVIILYYCTVRLFDAKSNKFDVVLFDFPRHSTILCLVFFLINLYLFIFKSEDYSQNRPYSFVFFWMPFTAFLAITAIIYFYGFMSIGASFKQNVFMHLFIAHAIAFIIIKFGLKYNLVLASK